MTLLIDMCRYVLELKHKYIGKMSLEYHIQFGILHSPRFTIQSLVYFTEFGVGKCVSKMSYYVTS